MVCCTFSRMAHFETTVLTPESAETSLAPAVVLTMWLHYTRSGLQTRGQSLKPWFRKGLCGVYVYAFSVPGVGGAVLYTHVFQFHTKSRRRDFQVQSCLPFLFDSKDATHCNMGQKFTKPVAHCDLSKKQSVFNSIGLCFIFVAIGNPVSLFCGDCDIRCCLDNLKADTNQKPHYSK